MTTAEQDDEVTLADIWAIMKRYKLTILAAPVVCGFAAYILVAFAMAPQWEASGILQVGQIGPSEKVEPVANVIVRIQHPSFAAGAINQANFKPEGLRAAQAIFTNTLKATKIKDADLIEFKLRGYSPDMARALADDTIRHLQKIHGDMVATGISRIKMQIQFAEDEIQALNAEMNALNKQLMGIRYWNSYNATMLGIIFQDKTNRLRELIQRKKALTEQLNPAITFSAKLFSDITVSEGPVAPKKSLIVGMAALLGLLGAVFIAFAHNAIRNTKLQS